MSDLYRIDNELAEMLAQDEGPSLGAYVRRLIQVGVLVPVEPCEQNALMYWSVPKIGDAFGFASTAIGAAHSGFEKEELHKNTDLMMARVGSWASARQIALNLNFLSPKHSRTALAFLP